MKFCNPEGKDQAELFQDAAFLELCTKTIKAIGMAVGNLHNLDGMIRMLIDLGGEYYEKGFLLEDYTKVLQAMQLTMKAGLR